MEDPNQLDLFADSAIDQCLRQFASGLVTGDLPAADDALSRLRALPRVAGLILQECQLLRQPLADTDLLLRDPQAGLRDLSTRLLPLAQRRLGAALACGYQRLLLTRLATAMDGRGHVSGRDLVHPAELWLQLDLPQRARDSVCADLFWRGCPLRLALHARICECMHLPVDALRDWIDLILLAPVDLDQTLSHSELLGASWSDFLDLDPSLDPGWFPCWLDLTGRQLLPADATHTLNTDEPQVQLLRLLQQTPRNARSSIEFRSAVQRACPLLLKHWLAARETRQ